MVVALWEKHKQNPVASSEELESPHCYKELLLYLEHQYHLLLQSHMPEPSPPISLQGSH